MSHTISQSLDNHTVMNREKTDTALVSFFSNVEMRWQVESGYHYKP